MSRPVLFLIVLSVMCAGAVPTPGQEPAPAAARVKLADLLAEAERNHPSIHAAVRVVEARRARIPQARALPDPVVSAGWMGNISPFSVQTGDPSSYRAVTAMEEFPFPGKLRLRGEIASREADAEQWNVEAARRRIRAQVKQAYYELSSVDQALDLTRKNKDLLEKLARIAEEKYKVGRGLQQDVLRAQIEVTRILQRLTLLNQRRRSLEAQLNSLLVRPPESSLGPLETIEQSPLNYSLEELLAAGVANAPEIRRQEEFIEQGRTAVNLVRKDYYPDLRLGYMYQQRPQMPDMHGLTFGINIPIFYRSKQRRAVDEATASLEGARQMREALRTELLFRVKEQYLTVRASEELLTLYAQGIVPQSTLALESALASYQVGTLDFLSLIANFITVLDYEVAYYEELANHQKALARIEEVTGLELAK